MPLIPETPSAAGGTYQPAAPSLSAAMAPGNALAGLGQDIAQAGKEVSDIAVQRQREQDHAAGARARIAMQQALQEHELYRATNPDETTWGADLNSRMAGVRTLVDKEPMSPAGRRQISTDLDGWTAQYGTQVQTDAANHQRARNRTSVTQLFESYHRAGKFDDAERVAKNAVETGLFHQEEMAPALNSLNFDREQKGKDDAYKARISAIDADPFTAAKKYESAVAPDGQDQAEWTRERDHSQRRLTAERNNIVDTLRDSIAGGKITRPEQIEEFKDELGEDAVRDIQVSMMRVKTAAEKQMLESPPEQARLVGVITSELKDLDPANVRQRLAIEDMMSDLKTGPTKEHLSSELKDRITGQTKPVTPATVAYKALDDYDSRLAEKLPKPERMTTRQIVAKGFFKDVPKLMSLGLSESAAETLRDEKEPSIAQKKFKDFWKNRNAGSVNADPITVKAADALLLDNADIDVFTTDSQRAADTAIDEFYRAKGERREKLTEYLKANPNATISDIQTKVRDLSDEQTARDIRAPMIPARPVRNGGKASGFKAGETSFTLPKNLEPFKQSFIDAGTRHGIDPRFLAAVSMHETANGTSSAFRNKNNAMGVSNSTGPIAFAATADSIARMAKVLASPNGPYKNATSLSGIASVYAPPGAGNDPGNLNPHWTAGVSKYLRQIGGDPDAIFIR